MNAAIAKLVRDAFANQRKHTAEVDGVQLVVEYDYSPAEPMTHWYPGADEELDITGILHEGMDIQAVMSADVVEMLEREVLAAIHNARELRREEDLIAKQQAWVDRGLRPYSKFDGIEPRY